VDDRRRRAETPFDAKFDALSDKLDARTAALDQKIDANARVTDAKITALHHKVDANQKSTDSRLGMIQWLLIALIGMSILSPLAKALHWIP
jgi:hypothetical protein